MFAWILIILSFIFIITSIISNIINIINYCETKNNIDKYEEYKKKLNG